MSSPSKQVRASLPINAPTAGKGKEVKTSQAIDKQKYQKSAKTLAANPSHHGIEDGTGPGMEAGSLKEVINNMQQNATTRALPVPDDTESDEFGADARSRHRCLCLYADAASRKARRQEQTFCPIIAPIGDAEDGHKCAKRLYHLGVEKLREKQTAEFHKAVQDTHPWFPPRPCAEDADLSAFNRLYDESHLRKEKAALKAQQCEAAREKAPLPRKARGKFAHITSKYMDSAPAGDGEEYPKKVPDAHDSSEAMTSAMKSLLENVNDLTFARSGLPAEKFQKQALQKFIQQLQPFVQKLAALQNQSNVSRVALGHLLTIPVAGPVVQLQSQWKQLSIAGTQAQANLIMLIDALCVSSDTDHITLVNPGAKRRDAAVQQTIVNHSPIGKGLSSVIDIARCTVVCDGPGSLKNAHARIVQYCTLLKSVNYYRHKSPSGLKWIDLYIVVQDSDLNAAASKERSPGFVCEVRLEEKEYYDIRKEMEPVIKSIGECLAEKYATKTQQPFLAYWAEWLMYHKVASKPITIGKKFTLNNFRENPHVFLLYDSGKSLTELVDVKTIALLARLYIIFDDERKKEILEGKFSARDNLELVAKVMVTMMFRGEKTLPMLNLSDYMDFIPMKVWRKKLTSLGFTQEEADTLLYHFYIVAPFQNGKGVHTDAIADFLKLGKKVNFYAVHCFYQSKNNSDDFAASEV